MQSTTRGVEYDVTTVRDGPVMMDDVHMDDGQHRRHLQSVGTTHVTQDDTGTIDIDALPPFVEVVRNVFRHTEDCTADELDEVARRRVQEAMELVREAEAVQSLADSMRFGLRMEPVGLPRATHVMHCRVPDQGVHA